MSYDVANDPYFNPDTGVLHNLLNIKTQSELEQVEAEITSVEISTILIESPAITVFDLELLREIHKQVFSHIYDWAGEIRRIELAKDKTRFAHSRHIESSAIELLEELKREDNLNNLSIDDFIKRIAHYYCELNIIHPFREGNGRVIRTFLSLLAFNAGKSIAWNRMNSKENIGACAIGYHGDEKPLQIMLEKLVEDI